MIEEPPLLTVKRPDRRPTDAQIAAFQGAPTSFVADAMWGTGVLLGVRPLLADQPAVAGPALTVENQPSGILALVASTPFIRKGDVVVNGFDGFLGVAAAGDRICGMMKNAGAAAFVTDGPMRDLPGLRAAGLPAWCAGLNPASPVSSGPGRIGLPTRIGGRVVETGDMVVADQDGVVVVPFEKIDEVIERLAAVRKLETELDAEVAKGLSVGEKIVELLASNRVRYV